MNIRHTTILLSAVILTLATGLAQTPTPPKVLIDQPLRIVEYQLNRLSGDELPQLERRPSDRRFRPVYMALLSRKNVATAFRDEALGVLVAMDSSTPTRVLLEALGKVALEDEVTADKLMAMLLSQSQEALTAERATAVRALEADLQPLAAGAAYALLMMVDGSPNTAWQMASSHRLGLSPLLRAVARLPGDARTMTVRTQLFEPISRLIQQSPPAAERVDALGALGWTRRDAGTFAMLARELATGTERPAKSAAIRSLLALPEDVWPGGAVERVVRDVIAFVGATPPAERTGAAATEAMRLGERLAAVLAEEPRRGVRRELRALGVRVVRLETIVEQMSYDVKWFAVQAGKPVQIVFVNRDAMPHNVVIGRPGTLEEIGTAAAQVPLPTDPGVKPYVPTNLPAVLQATFLMKEGETARLNFVAPMLPGEYVFLCTFPGHWVRMYGVMLVVPDLDAFEARPTPPTDPLTKQPYSVAGR